ncbi:putative magnesium transporter NIPA8 isoform X1 [Nicotiana tabacum]|uniref:Magnesium transporter NIPA8 isoform X1 n=3 Tax=Nicotiana tabacum TaxID=4097 RepID=A0AC58T0A7_TOBAC|nr:probable magnesium transporter NIPA8 isoform X1 [Nicotiana tomentosiformis]
MGEWVIGAVINLFGSVAINFGTNLLKLGHDEREKHSVLGNEGTDVKATMKPIIYFQTWRVGIVFFAIGNCLNFISFGYAAQSLLAALGSIQFVSNIAFAYFVLNKTVTIKVLVATAFIVLGNIFLVAFGNHQSPVYTPEQLAEKYSNITFLLYSLTLVLVVALHHSIYKRGELLLAVPMNENKPCWRMLLPFSYAVVSGAVGSCSVLFAKSLSNMLRLSMSSGYSLHSWFTYSMLLLFLSTAGFWMARLNEGLSFFDAILIVPMFQIAWTFFSICTGFVYFQEYQVFDALRTTMFILGMISVFVGISLLAPDESKGGEVKDGSLVSTTSNLSQDEERLFMQSEDSQIKDIRSFGRVMLMKTANMIVKAKAACSVSLGFGGDSLHASSVLVMPMVSSKITGFRGGGLDRAKLLSARGPGWSKFAVDEDGETILETTAMLPQVYDKLRWTARQDLDTSALAAGS